MAPMRKKLMKNVDLDEPVSYLDHVFLGCTERECKTNETIIERYTKMFGATEKYRDGKSLTQKPCPGPTLWKDMLENALSDTVNWQRRKWSKCTQVSSPCLDDHQLKQEELEPVGQWSEVCSQFVFKILYLARTGRPDILWSVKKLARSVTEWTQACGRRKARLISYIHHTFITQPNSDNIVMWATQLSIADGVFLRLRLRWRP